MLAFLRRISFANLREASLFRIFFVRNWIEFRFEVGANSAREVPMPDPTDPAIQNVIVFSFSGGARDGQALRSDLPEKQPEVQSLWALTWEGTVGRRFDVRAPGEAAFQRYQVKSKYQAGDEIHVTCEPAG
jgi:hypothetical protein